MRIELGVGDLVVFQRPNMDFREWEQHPDGAYLVGIVTKVEVAGTHQASYYYVHATDGQNYGALREDKLSLLAQC
jgi:hypothetical protein|tara:strand:+ start:1214 stop:1438 length:225 start_codon:yes stop_codon:yes gene_type:complete